MFSYLARKVFGSTNDRLIKSITPLVQRINALSHEMQILSDDALRSKTEQFKQSLADGQSLDDLLPEAFAVVREAAQRVLAIRHFDVQLIGGIILHKGMIAEMKTGEGKTLVATLAVYLNALSGKGVHVVTVNDYLAKRDAEWMGKVYNFLGLTVGCLTNDIEELERKQAYDADITYGTNNEFGFDYLRDNLKYTLKSMVQRQFHYAIVDEVDSILVDEARTPLIISGPTEDNSKLYGQIDKVISALTAEDCDLDEKSRSAMFTDKGHEKVEKILRQNKLLKEDSGVYDLENMMLVHHLNQALKAHKIFIKDVDYIIKDDKVMIIDEFTGRVMDGRRYSDGLHQAIEAKEGVKIQNENQTLASITFQNYFRMYPKLSGMTGTAMTEANEFADIYKLEVVEIPTNIPVTRIDEEDEIYRTASEKYDAIITEIEKAHKIGQPILVGTVSIEKSESLSALLKKKKIKHSVLNARYHEKEAEVIAQTGRTGAITIATNMAGRGTDIKLGGNLDMLIKNIEDSKSAIEKLKKQVAKEHQEVLDNGGLLVIGTERHESRRIDNQLRGRSGRQGDAGRTKFFLSLEDDLMRIFGSTKISNMLSTLGLKQGEAIIHPWISKSIAKAQQRVEARNYEMRKNLLKFDNVMNEQRRVIYGQRIDIMSSDNLVDSVKDIMENVNRNLVSRHIPKNLHKDDYDLAGIEKEFFRIYGIHLELEQNGTADSESSILALLQEKSWNNFAAKIDIHGNQLMEEVVRRIFLVSLDHLWKDHLHCLDHMRTGISLRAYAQKDPLNEYKMEAFRLFQSLLDELDEVLVQRCVQLHISRDTDDAPHSETHNQHQLADNSEQSSDNHSSSEKIPRNAPCPCNSGRKYKHCHGMLN